MKIVRIIARLNIGGPARHVALACGGLRPYGYETVVVHGEPERDEGSLEDLLPPDTRAIKLAGLGRSVRPWTDVRVFGQLVRLLFREQPDIVHTHTTKAGVLGRAAAAVYNARQRRSTSALVVHTFHGHVFDGYFHPLANRAVRAIERTLARFSDAIVAIAPGQHGDLVDRFRIAPPEKTSVIRLGLDLAPLLTIDENSPSLRRELGWQDDDVVIGYVGRFVPIKNLGALVRAFARAAERVPSARLAFAGEGAERRALERIAADLHVTDRVAFLGWRRDLPRLYRAFDIVALASRNEGTPVAIIEAMAAALPVIATRVGGVPDVVGDGETGLLVESADEAALADAIVALAIDPPMRRRMGAAGRRLAAANYSADRLAMDLNRLYLAGLQAKRGHALAAAVR